MFHPQAIPLVQQYVSPNKALHVPVAAGGIFLVTLLVAYFITSKLSDMILDSRIGALDRTLGFAFGAARGLLLAVVGFLFFSWLAQDEKNHPVWVRDAKLKPMLVSAGATSRACCPTTRKRRSGSFAARRSTARRRARPCRTAHAATHGSAGRSNPAGRSGLARGDAPGSRSPAAHDR